jgi:hypothetical protein
MSGATPVGGTTWYTSSPATSLLYQSYSGTYGNWAIMFVQFDAAVTGFTVTPYSAYAAGMNVIAGPVVGNLYCFFVQFISYSPYLMFNWTGSANMGVVLEEYSGVTQVSSTNSATTSGTSGTASDSLTTDDASGNTIVAGMGNITSDSFTATTGNLRQQETSSSDVIVALLDNTNSSPGSLTVAASLTSTAWDMILVELRYVIADVAGTGFATAGNGISQGQIANGDDASTNVALGNPPIAFVNIPYGQTWPRG